MPHLLYLAIGFPPAAKSCAYRMRTTANLFCEAGWDVTVITLQRSAWQREYGLDPTMEAGVDPRVRVVELPLARVDLDPDIRGYGWLRARDPVRWRRMRYALDRRHFPEQIFGSWRSTLERAAEQVHRERPADLVLVSPAPYTMLAAAWRLFERHSVPFVVDYRDAWSLDVIGGVEAFPVDSRAGAWERRLIENARSVWCVNEPIKAFYAARYPAAADRLRVVRNGFDADVAAAHVHTPRKDQPLTFGYLGTVNLSVGQMDALLAGWRTARSAEEAMAGARLEFRGHIGAGAAKSANAHTQRILRHAGVGVSYGGPVRKADVAGVYGSWDALVLALVGGRYVTSGKVYEYMATGLPIASVHEPEHAAAEVLCDYPLWAPTASLDPDDIAKAFAEAARLATTADPATREAALACAGQFERARQLQPAIEEIVESFAKENAPS